MVRLTAILIASGGSNRTECSGDHEEPWGATLDLLAPCPELDLELHNKVYRIPPPKNCFPDRSSIELVSHWWKEREHKIKGAVAFVVIWQPARQTRSEIP
jgi:hypothetical protein